MVETLPHGVRGMIGSKTIRAGLAALALSAAALPFRRVSGWW